MSLIQSFVEKKVSVITLDGRVFVGNLKGTDQAANVILADCEERVFSTDGTESVTVGVYLIRGDNLCVIGEIDVEKDDQIDFDEVTADPLPAAQL